MKIIVKFNLKNAVDHRHHVSIRKVKSCYENDQRAYFQSDSITLHMQYIVLIAYVSLLDQDYAP